MEDTFFFFPRGFVRSLQSVIALGDFLPPLCRGYDKDKRIRNCYVRLLFCCDEASRSLIDVGVWHMAYQLSDACLVLAWKNIIGT